jgi:hypothetical protein
MGEINIDLPHIPQRPRLDNAYLYRECFHQVMRFGRTGTIYAIIRSNFEVRGLLLYNEKVSAVIAGSPVSAYA